MKNGADCRGLCLADDEHLQNMRRRMLRCQEEVTEHADQTKLIRVRRSHSIALEQEFWIAGPSRSTTPQVVAFAMVNGPTDAHTSACRLV